MRAAGHEVLTPTLTGLGERAHLLAPEIGLETHIQDVVAVFEYEDVKEAIFVAHSYGGTVACGAMEHIADRVRTIVFIDAHMPRTGERVLDQASDEIVDLLLKLADEKGEGWYIPPEDASYWGITDPADVAWVNERVSAQPLKTYTDSIGSTERAWVHPGIFIECRDDFDRRHVPVARPRERSATDKQFEYRTMDVPHDVMVAAPEALAEILLEVALRGVCGGSVVVDGVGSL